MTVLSIYQAIIYATLYMCFAAFPIVYQEKRGWSAGIGGLAFLGVSVGMIATIPYNIWTNHRYAKLSDLHKGFAPPESRLLLCMAGAVTAPVGLFWVCTALQSCINITDTITVRLDEWARNPLAGVNCCWCTLRLWSRRHLPRYQQLSGRLLYHLRSISPCRHCCVTFCLRSRFPSVHVSDVPHVGHTLGCQHSCLPRTFVRSLPFPVV